jgi:hypothetical protein
VLTIQAWRGFCLHLKIKAGMLKIAFFLYMKYAILLKEITQGFGHVQKNKPRYHEGFDRQE